MKKKFLAAALVAVMSLAAVFTGCSSSSGDAANGEGASAETESAASGDVIKIGVLQPITGSMAAGAAIEIEGIELAQSERPTVTIDGKEYTVELVKADNKSDKVEAANAATKLIESDQVSVILGSYSSTPSLGAYDVIRNGNVPAIGLSCTNPAVTEGNDNYFRVCFIDPYQGKAMANYAYNKLGAKTAAVTTEQGNDYSVGLAQYFTEEFEALGGTVYSAAYQTGDQDFNAQITSLKANNPDVFFVPGNFTEAAMFIKQAKQAGVTATILGGDTYEVQEFIDVAGAESEGVMFSAFFDPDAELTPLTKDFVAKYREANDGNDPAGCTALGYDGYNLACDAIEAANSTDPVAIRDAIANIDFVGVTGPVKFDENGDPTKAAVVKKVENGKFVYADAITAE
ncbi:MAG: ABC transporter substrate-binding protein [Clostridia bacterium]|nr:ABC transporter substrate-binding protein [Clostridia bacterium]